jgi:YggT family protein
MLQLIHFVVMLIGIYSTLLFVAVMFSWLVQFGIINSRNPFVQAIETFLRAITEPFLRPIRRMLPNLGPFDFSPIVLYFILLFLMYVVFSTDRGSFLCTGAALCG